MNNNIKTTDLDFDQIKENIKEFLRGQEKFSDYNFDGSAMSIFLDVLAYNTHYNALYTNLAINEMFLDSAVKYSSVVSLAKTLGYTAKSVTSSRAKVNVEITTNSSDQTLVIPKGTVFSGSTGDNSFDFITDSDYYAQNISGTNLSGKYRFIDMTLIEGKQMTKRYLKDLSSEFVVPSKSADISTLSVKVQDTEYSSNYVAYGPVESVLTLTGDSKVFFVKQREDLYYEVYFGNGTIGSAIQSGNIVHLSYILSSGEVSNSARSFSYKTGITFDYNTITVETVSSAFGGADIEEIESVRYNAPRAFGAQNRAVTSEDYKNILLNNFPTIESITVWGGQEQSPPVYGKVFISAKPKGALSFTTSEKEDIVNFLTNSKGVISISPVMVDPKFVKLELTTNVYYNKNTTRRSVGEIKSIILSSLVDYSASLGKFGNSFRHSKVLTLINGADDSITSNITTLRLRVGVSPYYNKNVKYDVLIGNPIYQNSGQSSFYSTRFYINSNTVTNRCYLKDDGLGNVNLYSEDSDGVPSFIKTVGSVEYSNGRIIVKEVSIKGLYDDTLEFVVIPLSNDVIPTREYILQMPESLISVNMIIDTVESAGSTNTSYNFSSSR
jgi:hypothetical protein